MTTPLARNLERVLLEAIPLTTPARSASLAALLDEVLVRKQLIECALAGIITENEAVSVILSHTQTDWILTSDSRASAQLLETVREQVRALMFPSDSSS